MPKKFKSKTVKVRGYYTIICVIFLLLIDRLTKVWASGLKHEIDYGIFAFTYVTNTGAGFSMLQNMNLLLIIISILVLGILIYFNEKIPFIPNILIISGIIGNIVDRIFYGRVIDFINLKFWPIFNVADSLICIGVAYLIIIILMNNNQKNIKTSSTAKRKK